MLFNSIEFLLFLPITFFLYWFVFNVNLRLQNALVVVASYLFYGWWDWRFLILIAFTSLLSWASGLLIEFFFQNKNSHKQKYAKWVSVSNIVINLGILAVFKYFNFFVDSFVQLFQGFGISLSITTLKIILPVGVSFYTFQALSYSIDIYKRKMRATRDIVAFFAYVSFFPQLVAGPIERATHLLPQFSKKRTFDYNQATDGLRQILWGFFKKVIIADNCAIYVNQVFDSYQDYSGSTLLLATILFAFQIYGDFSGYSDIAIGTAKLFGINLMKNFNLPYFSRDIAEFWRRWHISLTTWFRDYIYIPLGGSRVSKMRVLRNTLIVFLISGLWHGANWTFVIWGLFHAILFLPLILTKNNRKYTDNVAQNRWLPSLKESFQMMTTFLLVCIGWIFFRADTIHMAFDYMFRILNPTLFQLPFLMNQSYYIPLFVFILVLLIVEWIQRDKDYGLELNTRMPLVLRWGIYVLLLFVLVHFKGSQDTFIYFQF